MGLTDGSASKNLALQSQLNSGYNPYASQAPAATSAAPANNSSIAQQFIDNLLPADKKIEAYTGKPVYGTTPEEYAAWEKSAIAYAESAYGTYFANQLKQYTDEANVATNRVNEDTQYTIQNLQTQLQDYLDKSRVDQQRIEQDYNTARTQEAQKLGIDLESLSIAQTREAEDSDRTLAELQTDYELSGGRISEDKAKNLGRLLTDYSTSVGRLSQDQQTIISNLNRDYSDALDDQTKALAAKGQTFSGNRLKAEAKMSDNYELSKDQANLTYGRNLQDTRQNFEYGTQDVTDQANRNLQDLTSEYTKATEGTRRSYQRNLADLTRQGMIARQNSANTQTNLTTGMNRSLEDAVTGVNQATRNTATDTSRQTTLQNRSLYDITEQLRKQALENEQNKQAQVETGYFGVEGQYGRASDNYERQKANYYAGTN